MNVFERETPKLDEIYNNYPIEYEDMDGKRHMVIECHYIELAPYNCVDIDDDDLELETALAVQVRDGINHYLFEEEVKTVYVESKNADDHT